MNYTLDHPDIGTVLVTVRRNTRSMTMRWRDGVLHMGVPPTASPHEVMQTLDRYSSRLIARKPTVRFHPDDTLQFQGLTVAIGRQLLRPDKILAQLHGTCGTVSIGSSIDPDNDETARSVSRLICRMALRVAPECLIPRGRELARLHGVSPRGWEISRGHRKLGHCTSTRIVSLSYILMFLPPHLRDYIILHELAHLSEMNHSPRFHALCDRYCGGREKLLVAELRRYPWPVLL